MSYLAPTIFAVLSLVAALFFLALARWWNSLVEPVDRTAFHDLASLGPYATFFDIIVIVAALCAVLLALAVNDDSKVFKEFYLLLMLVAPGMMLMALAPDLIALFLVLELTSLSLWATAALERRDRVEVEAKFMLLGMLGSAMTLFGIVLLYCAAGSTELRAMVATLSSEAADARLVIPEGEYC